MFAKKKKQTFVESKRFAAKVSPYFALHHKAQITSRLWQLFVGCYDHYCCLSASELDSWRRNLFFLFLPHLLFTPFRCCSWTLPQKKLNSKSVNTVNLYFSQLWFFFVEALNSALFSMLSLPWFCAHFVRFDGCVPRRRRQHKGECWSLFFNKFDQAWIWQGVWGWKRLLL